MLHTVIMAGGGGTRLWPLSTSARPKQFLSLDGGRSILEITAERVGTIVPPERTWIVTTRDQAEMVRELKLGLPDSNIIAEPEGRNTAPCIGLAAVHLRAVDPEAIMLVLPADHLIRDVKAFADCVAIAVRHCLSDNGLVTFGIVPTRPETGYGYIQAASMPTPSGTHDVIAFKEKPDNATALQFLRSGDYYWNSGMFVWSVKTILEEFARNLSKHHSLLDTMVECGLDTDEAARIYREMPSISIDYGILEKSEQVHMVRGAFDWSDVGGYEELMRISSKDQSGNHLEGNVLVEGVVDSFVMSNDPRPVAVIGLEGVTVVVNPDGILVTRTSESQKVKLAAEWAKRTS